MDVGSFAILTEFGVALAGFSGIAIAFSHDRGALAPIDRFRTLNLLMWTLGAAFVSTFPLVLQGFGVAGDAIWRGSSAGFVAVLTYGTAVPIRLRRGLEPHDRANLSPLLWVLAVGGNVMVAFGQLPNLLAPVGRASPGPILAGIVWLLFFAALLFVRLLVNRPGAPAN